MIPVNVNFLHATPYLSEAHATLSSVAQPKKGLATSPAKFEFVSDWTDLLSDGTTVQNFLNHLLVIMDIFYRKKNICVYM